ncbi:MAG TPA: hypothetical protein VFU93_14485 [Acidimicrobiales bacterium]|nr:hypothetical protein [Acidimicrobiales bacterium]
MSMSTFNQLHADRTARLQAEQRLLRRPTLPSFRFTRKERRLATARVAPTC